MAAAEKPRQEDSVLKVPLFDYDRKHRRFADIPDGQKQPQVIMWDGVPYVADGTGAYVLAGGVSHVFTREPLIAMVKVFDKPVVAEANSTKWFSGTVGEAKMILHCEIKLPWMDTMKLSVVTTRPIRVHGVWSPDHSDIAVTFEGRKARQELWAKCRRLTNEFCNTFRPQNSKLMLSMMGLDMNGRLVCEIHKHIPALIGGAGAQVLSLRKALLESGSFTPAQWRLP